MEFFAPKDVNRKGKSTKAYKRARREQRKEEFQKQELQNTSTQPFIDFTVNAATYVDEVASQILTWFDRKQEELESMMTTTIHHSSDYIEFFLRERRFKRSTNEQCY